MLTAFVNHVVHNIQPDGTLSSGHYPLEYPFALPCRNVWHYFLLQSYIVKLSPTVVTYNSRNKRFSGKPVFHHFHTAFNKEMDESVVEYIEHEPVWGEFILIWYGCLLLTKEFCHLTLNLCCCSSFNEMQLDKRMVVFTMPLCICIHLFLSRLSTEGQGVNGDAGLFFFLIKINTDCDACLNKISRVGVFPAWVTWCHIFNPYREVELLSNACRISKCVHYSIQTTFQQLTISQDRLSFYLNCILVLWMVKT